MNLGVLLANIVFEEVLVLILLLFLLELLLLVRALDVFWLSPGTVLDLLV